MRYIQPTPGDDGADAYFFARTNPEVLYNFKGEQNYALADIAPELYEQYKYQSVQHQQEKYDEARDLFAEVAEGRSDFALQARLYEAQSYFHQGLFAKAVALMDDLILRNPDTQEAELARRFLENNGLD